MKKREKRQVRRKRIRAKVSGTNERPRLSVFRSNRFISAQLIDDKSGKTLASASDMKSKKKGKMTRAEEVGKAVAEAAKAKKISEVTFDRGGYIYTGRVKALAEAARGAGLKF